MKTIQVYHMYIDIEIPEGAHEVTKSQKRTGFFKVIGSVEYQDQIDPETIWHLTNWSCWMDYDFEHEPTEIQYKNYVYKRTKYDRGYTNDDICFCIDNIWYAADHFGWSRFTTLEQAKRHLFNNAQWIRINNECDNPVEYEDLIC
jgi:hypothetical protein